MSEKAHLRDELQELLDRRLPADRAAEVNAHLEACSACRGEYEALAWVKKLAAESRAGAEAPEGLVLSLKETLDLEDRQRAGLLAPRRWRLFLAAAASLLLGAVALIWLLGRGPVDLPAEVSRDYQRFRASELPLGVATGSAAEVEAFFRREGIRFRTRVFDLAMMNYRVAGGRVHRLADGPSAFFVYEGEGGKLLVCQMYPGRLADLPPSAEVRSRRGFDFYIYRRGALTLVFWQEGDVACVLIGDFDSEEIVGLAFEKAML